MKKIIVASCLLLAVGLIVSCGQSIPEVKSATSVPQNLVVKGIVYGMRYVPESSSYDWQVIAPVSGATVSLVGSFETKTAVTNNLGEYVFENVKNGNYMLEASKEGYQTGENYLSTDSILFFGAQAASVKASSIPDGTIFTVDLDMYTNPVMRVVSPLPNSTIETSSVFTITFNEPMDTASIRPEIMSYGVRTFAVGDTVNATSTWSGGNTILTISPNSPLLPNLTYRLYIGYTAFDDVKDADGNRLASSTSTSYGIPVEEHGDVIENNDYFTYKTSTGGAPGVPGNLQVVVNGMPFSSEAGVGADFADIFGLAKVVGLNWTAGSGTITGYKVYVSDSPSNNFQLLHQAGSPATYTEDVYYPTDMEHVLQALYGTNYIDPIGTGNYPMINKRIYFKVVAFNGEYESASAEASAIDLVGPQLDAFTKAPYTAQVLINNYYLPKLDATADKNNLYITVQEPIDPTSVTTSNFTVEVVASSATTVSSATLMTRGSSDLGTSFGGADYSVLLIKTDQDLTAADPGRKVHVKGLKDLAGNTMAPQALTIN